MAVYPFKVKFLDEEEKQIKLLAIFHSNINIYWVTQKLPQIYTVILRIRIGKVAWFAVYIYGNFWVTQYIYLEGSQSTRRSWGVN